MLPLKVHTVSPYVKDRTRLLVLTSGAKYGNVPYHDEIFLDRLDKIVSNMNNDNVHLTHNRLHIRDFPDLTRERISSNNISSDILLKDTFRQHKGIEERYRKSLPNVRDIKMIYEPATKFHYSISRGYERDIVDFFGKIDSELIDRNSLKIY